MPQPVAIYLVRHGEADAHWGQSADPGLSDLGQKQADASARQLARRIGTDAVIVSSPLTRAMQTAAPLARICGLDFQVEEAFREIPAPVPLAQRRDWLRGFMRQDWANQPADLHAWRDALLSSLVARPSTTVIFTHFLVINTIVGHALGESRTQCFWPDNASITEINLNDQQLELIERGREMETPIN